MTNKHAHVRARAALLGETVRRAFAAACLVIPAFGATAWDGNVSGKISRLDGVGGTAGAPGNHDLRVFLEGQSALCAGAIDPSWAYINSNDANYKGLMALLLTAYMSGKTVGLYTNKGPTGYCQIGYVYITG